MDPALKDFFKKHNLPLPEEKAPAEPKAGQASADPMDAFYKRHGLTKPEAPKAEPASTPITTPEAAPAPKVDLTAQRRLLRSEERIGNPAPPPPTPMPDLPDNLRAGIPVGTLPDEALYLQTQAEPAVSTKNLVAGFGGVAQGLGSAAKWAGADDVAKSLKETGAKLQTANRGVEGPEWKDLQTPGDYWDYARTKGVQALAFPMAAAPLGVAGAYGGAAAAGALGLGTLGTTALVSLGGALASRPFESAIEAGQTYEDALQRGMGEEEASKAARSTFWKNNALFLMDTGELFTALAPLPAPLKKVLGAIDLPSLKGWQKAAATVFKAGATGVQEAGEEGLQDIAQRTSLGDEVKFDDQMKEAMFTGGLMGAGLGGAGSFVNLGAKKPPAPTPTPTPEANPSTSTLQPGAVQHYDTHTYRLKERLPNGNWQVEEITDDGTSTIREVTDTLAQRLFNQPATPAAEATETPATPVEEEFPPIKTTPFRAGSAVQFGKDGRVGVVQEDNGGDTLVVKAQDGMLWEVEREKVQSTRSQQVQDALGVDRAYADQVADMNSNLSDDDFAEALGKAGLDWARAKEQPARPRQEPDAEGDAGQPAPLQPTPTGPETGNAVTPPTTPVEPAPTPSPTPTTPPEGWQAQQKGKPLTVAEADALVAKLKAQGREAVALPHPKNAVNRQVFAAPTKKATPKSTPSGVTTDVTPDITRAGFKDEASARDAVAKAMAGDATAKKLAGELTDATIKALGGDPAVVRKVEPAKVAQPTPIQKASAPKGTNLTPMKNALTQRLDALLAQVDNSRFTRDELYLEDATDLRASIEAADSQAKLDAALLEVERMEDRVDSSLFDTTGMPDSERLFRNVADMGPSPSGVLEPVALRVMRNTKSRTEFESELYRRLARGLEDAGEMGAPATLEEARKAIASGKALEQGTDPTELIAQVEAAGRVLYGVETKTPAVKETKAPTPPKAESVADFVAKANINEGDTISYEYTVGSRKGERVTVTVESIDAVAIRVKTPEGKVVPLKVMENPALAATIRKEGAQASTTPSTPPTSPETTTTLPSSQKGDNKASGQGKQPWQMRRSDFLETQKQRHKEWELRRQEAAKQIAAQRPNAGTGEIGRLSREAVGEPPEFGDHYRIVRMAVLQGEDVPLGVLRDYYESDEALPGTVERLENEPYPNGKRVWEMTVKEFQNLPHIQESLRGAEDTSFEMQTLADVHRKAVRAALSKGQAVPPQVFADYPDLAPKTPAVPVESGKKATPPKKPSPLQQLIAEEGGKGDALLLKVATDAFGDVKKTQRANPEQLAKWIGYQVGQGYALDHYELAMSLQIDPAIAEAMVARLRSQPNFDAAQKSIQPFSENATLNAIQELGALREANPDAVQQLAEILQPDVRTLAEALVQRMRNGASNWDYALRTVLKLAEADAMDAPESAYRMLLNTRSKSPLKRGQTWRGEFLKHATQQVGYVETRPSTDGESKGSSPVEGERGDPQNPAYAGARPTLPGGAKEPWRMTKAEFENGALYHGTAKGAGVLIETDGFDPAMFGARDRGPAAEPDYKGVYLTEDAKKANEYYSTSASRATNDVLGGGDVVRVRIDAERLIPQGEWRKLYFQASANLLDEDGNSAPKQTVLDEQVRLAKERGYVGVKFRGGEEIVIFDPKDAKLHKQVIKQALKEGKAVPSEVLADYPDLAPKKQPEAKSPRKSPLQQLIEEEGGDVENPAFFGGRPALPQGIPQMPAPLQPVSRREIVKYLNNAFGPLRLGFADKVKGALGIFKTREGVIRTQRAEDFPVQTHEIGHKLDKAMQLADPAFDNELIPLGTVTSPPNASQQYVRGEGVGEFIRLYITDPARAQQAAPNFAAHFDARMAAEPDIKAKIDGARELVKRWNAQDPHAKMAGIISVDEKGNKRAVTAETLRAQVVEQLAPLERVVKALSQGRKLNIGDNPFELALLARGWAGRAEAFLGWGTVDADFNKTGESFKDILKAIPDLDEFRRYTVSLRANEIVTKREAAHTKAVQDEAAVVATIKALKQQISQAQTYAVRNPLKQQLALAETDLDVKRKALARAKERLLTIEEVLGTDIKMSDVNQVIQDLAPKYSALQQRLVKFQDTVLQELVNSGRISAKEAQDMRGWNEQYIPFYRFFDEKTGEFNFKGANHFVNVGNPLKEFKGSGRSIIDPLESVIKNTYAIINAAQRNEVGRALYRLSKTANDMGKVVEVVDEEARDSNIVNIYDDGEKIRLKLDPELYRSLLFLDREQTAMWVKIVGMPAKTLRAGAILNPDFMVSNPVNDQFAAYINSEFGYVPGLDFIRGAKEVAQKSDMYWKWKAAGGAQASLVSLDRDYLQKELNKLIKSGTLKGHVVKDNPLDYLLDPLRNASEFGESATRLGEFRKGVQADNSREGIQRAALGSRDVILDFARTGSKTKTANQLSAFFNASIQGLDKTYREFKANPVRTALRASAAYLLPTIALYAINRDNPNYDEKDEWVKDAFWLIPTDWSGGLDSARQSKHFIWIPKKHVLAMTFAALPERILRALDKDDPQAFDAAFAGRLAGSFSPSVPIPTGLLPLLEVTANHSFYTDAPIVPVREQRSEPVEQYGTYTSEFSKGVARAADQIGLGFSPRKLDHLIRGYGGGLGTLGADIISKGMDATGLGDRIPKADRGVAAYPVARRFLRDYGGAGEGSSVDVLTDKLNEAERLYKRVQERAAQGDPMNLKDDDYKTLQFMGAKSVEQAFSNLRKQKRAIEADMRMDPKEKRRRIDEIDEQMTNLARGMLGKAPMR